LRGSLGAIARLQSCDLALLHDGTASPPHSHSCTLASGTPYNLAPLHRGTFVLCFALLHCRTRTRTRTRTCTHISLLSLALLHPHRRPLRPRSPRHSAENGEHAKLPYAHTLASLLSSRNLIRTTDILHVPAGDTRAPGWANNTTSRCRATRARRELGWKPRFKMDEEELGRDVRDILKVWGK
jgi:hypothetical protein